MSCPDCDCIEIGDVVEHRMNTNVFGIVIGFMGSIVIIRVSPTLDVLQFHEWELQAVDDDEIPPPDAAAISGAEDDNVIDFTKERKLRKTTTTRGAA
ncbi:hypothetical protein GGE68_002983 [Rhizobium leguminosarum]|uniref:hypothetical protein n=1 Tax=Rhizobium leguminosarum TaxID=384 RepID=UPI001620FF8C|nr:hypothetical protein [Rhizobium leguminosarum]MBB5664786.1 hypothetical protein [Rhizobium leguminosarum]